VVELAFLAIVCCILLGMWLFASALAVGLGGGFDWRLTFQAVGSSVSVALFVWSAEAMYG
jgi:hypothetical protein